MRAPRSRKRAIETFCRSCIYDGHAHGTWREQVERCTSLMCALYELRPRSIKTARTKSGGSPGGLERIPGMGPGEAEPVVKTVS